jgi:hypothetical protein
MLLLVWLVPLCTICIVILNDVYKTKAQQRGHVCLQGLQAILESMG